MKSEHPSFGWVDIVRFQRIELKDASLRQEKVSNQTKNREND